MDTKRDGMVKALNSLKIVDFSASGGELEYVLAENSKENKKVLMEAGFAENDIQQAMDHQDDNNIDLTYLAVNIANIYCWIKGKGFVEESDYNKWELKTQGAI